MLWKCNINRVDTFGAMHALIWVGATVKIKVSRPFKADRAMRLTLLEHSMAICNGNWSKRRQTETSTTKTSTNQNVDKPKRRKTETSTNQNVDKPIRRQTETTTNQNVDKPKRRQAKTSTHQNVDKPKRRHSISLYYMLWCSRIFVFIICGMHCMYIRT